LCWSSGGSGGGICAHRLASFVNRRAAPYAFIYNIAAFVPLSFFHDLSLAGPAATVHFDLRTFGLAFGSNAISRCAE
jgi:hypothetical protein